MSLCVADFQRVAACLAGSLLQPQKQWLQPTEAGWQVPCPCMGMLLCMHGALPVLIPPLVKG